MKNLYWGEKIAFATMHGKEKILKDLFYQDLKTTFVVPTINTDIFGTFSGEIERTRDIRGTLRAKAQQGLALSGLDLAIASEGSFGPHPSIPFVSCNHEALLLVDAKNLIEIYASTLSTQNAADGVVVEDHAQLKQFCERVGCGDSQAVIVKPHKDSKDAPWIFKGLQSVAAAQEAVEHLKKSLDLKTVWVETDNRAHMSRSRQKVILQAGEELLKAIHSRCLDCGLPGFQMTGVEPGLPCEDCGQPSDKPLREVWACASKYCKYTEVRPRRDGLQGLDPDECDRCNP